MNTGSNTQIIILTFGISRAVAFGELPFFHRFNVLAGIYL